MYFPCPWEKSRVTAAVALVRDNGKKSLLLKIKNSNVRENKHRAWGNLLLSGNLH